MVGQHFLVLQDNIAGSADSVSKLIEAWGGMVDQVTKATEAMNALSARDYDAVYVDDSADKNESMQFVQTLQMTNMDNKTKLIMAGSEAQNNESTVSEPSKTQFLEKPFSGKILLKSLLNSGKFEVTHCITFIMATLSQYLQY